MIYFNMTKKDIQNIVGIEQPHKLKRFVLTAGDVVMESSYLVYDDTMKCYGYWDGPLFNVVIIKQESDVVNDLR